MIACAGCLARENLTTLENHDPATGNVTGLVYSCPDCLAEMSGRPDLAPTLPPPTNLSPA